MKQKRYWLRGGVILGGLVAIVMLVLTFSGIKSTEVDNFPFIIKFPILLEPVSMKMA